MRATNRSLLAVCLLAAHCLWANGSTRAAPPEDEARYHQERGTLYFDLRRYDEAVAEYRKAYELRADPGLLFDLAQAYRLLGSAENAHFFYKRYLATNPPADKRALAEGHLAGLQKPGPEGAGPAPAASVGPTGAVTPGPAAAAPQNQATLVASPAPAGGSEPSGLHRPWLWTAAGVALVAVVAGVVLFATRGSETPIPSSELGNEKIF